MKKSRLTALIVICVMVSQLFLSCNSANAGKKDIQTTTAAGDVNGNAASETAAESDSGETDYVYPNLNCNGEDFNILNTTTTWGFYTDLVHESMTGEVLDDAIYTRNSTIEDKFNVNIKEIPEGVDTSSQKLRTAVQAGDNAYDAAYVPCNSSIPIGSLVTDNILYNLSDIPELNLDQKWWNQSIKQDSALGTSKSLYFAFCDINIMPLQCAWCIYINEDMMKKLGLDLPYSLVKSGKWTYDEFYKYMEAGAQLNGAQSFKWDDNAPTVYGYTSFENGTLALITASGERGVSIDNSGMPSLAVDSERFFNVCDKLSQMLATKDKGEYLTANASNSLFHFEVIFGNCRALMMGGELKAADSFRNMDDTFGIVPMPKYDETQDRYYTAVTVQTPVLVVPVTNTNTSRTGVILDAMAYLSNKDVTPVFFDVTMSQKRLRDDESINMLQIVKDSLYFNVGIAYGWTQNMIYAIRDSLDGGKGNNVVSTVDKMKAQAQASMDKTMTLIESKG
ncbi:MAG: extracellular solute-binding protein [Oscillospiraceae bacterium]|nr:extracellular solute-binding protein [Oscillospiraceae bacterium]